MIWALLAENLMLTILIEIPLSWLLFRTFSLFDIGIMALAQVATNPILNLTLAYTWRLFEPPMPYVFLIALELAAVLIEGAIYRYARVGDSPWLMSALLNLTSLAIGLFLGVMF